MANETNAKLVDFNGTSKERGTIAEISEIAQKVLKNERNINITMAQAIPTIAYEFIYACAQWLEKNKSVDTDTMVNLMNLLEMGVTYREAEDGEKSGNFTPYLQPGTILKTVIKSDELTEDEE